MALGVPILKHFRVTKNIGKLCKLLVLYRFIITQISNANEQLQEIHQTCILVCSIAI